MNIELRGVEFVNKGAELMLHAILNYVKAEIPEAKFIMETTHRSPKIKLDSVGIWEKSNFKKRGINFEWIAAFLPQSYFNKRRIVLESDIDVIFDASGFAYGDKWGAQKAAVRSGDHLSKWKSQGKKVIFLPQAFGPFSSQEIINEMDKQARPRIRLDEETAGQYERLLVAYLEREGGRRELLMKRCLVNGEI